MLKFITITVASFLPFFYCCSNNLFENTGNPKEVVESYLKIVASYEDIVKRTDDVYNLISSSDKEYLENLSTIYFSLNESKWLERFQKSPYDVTEAFFFKRSLEEKINSPLEFRRAFIEDVLLADKNELSSYTFLNVRNVSATENVVTYNIKGKKVSFRVISENENNLLLLSTRLEVWEKSFLKLLKMTNRQPSFFWDKTMVELRKTKEK